MSRPELNPGAHLLRRFPSVSHVHPVPHSPIGSMLDGRLWWHVILLALCAGFGWSAGCWAWSLLTGAVKSATEKKSS